MPIRHYLQGQGVAFEMALVTLNDLLGDCVSGRGNWPTPTGHQPEDVVLDLVNPVGAGRGLWAGGRETGESVETSAATLGNSR